MSGGLGLIPASVLVFAAAALLLSLLGGALYGRCGASFVCCRRPPSRVIARLRRRTRTGRALAGRLGAGALPGPSHRDRDRPLPRARAPHPFLLDPFRPLDRQRNGLAGPALGRARCRPIRRRSTAKVVASARGRPDARGIALPPRPRGPGAWSTWTARSALTAGLIRPRIYLSKRLLNALSPAELAAVVAHEQAHRRRRDAVRQLVAEVLGRLHLPPSADACWRICRLATERACDEEAALSGHGRLGVAGTILKVARLNAAHQRPTDTLLPTLTGADLEAGSRPCCDLPRSGRFRPGGCSPPVPASSWHSAVSIRTGSITESSRPCTCSFA